MAGYLKTSSTSKVKQPKIKTQKVSYGSSSGSGLSSLGKGPKTKTSYSKQKPTDASAFGAISFGQTGLTGED